MQNKIQIVENIGLNIEKERSKMGISQEKMAKLLGMSFSGYRNLISGRSSDVSTFTLYNMCHVTNKSFYELCGETETDECRILVKYRNLPNCRKKAVQAMVDIESELAIGEDKDAKANSVPMYIPLGNMEDGMTFCSANKECLDISDYKNLSDHVDCACKVTSNHLHPCFHQDDILLISRRPPRDGDIGLFIRKSDKRTFIRKFRQTEPCRLEPIVDYGEVITVDSKNAKEMNNWMKFGVVVTVKR